MKKFLLFSALISLMACSQVDIDATDIPLGGTNITLGLPNTRTSLGEKENGTYPIYWSEEDKIVVNGAVSSSILIDKNRKSATFNFANDILSYPYCITYPYTKGSSCPDGTPTVVFATEQHFVEGTFGVGAAPMCGYCESGGSPSLKHLAGVLQLAIKGSSTLADIKISAAENVALSGEFGVDCQSGTISAIEGKVANKLTYVVNQTLSTAEAKVCHIVVPTGNLGACKVLLTADNGEQMILKWNASDVKAGVVREFKEFTFKPGTMLDLEGLPSEEDDLVIIPPTPRPANNEIWYTSSDGEVVMPYSGEYNEYADALTTFGANIVSNTYENGKGIIKFDSDVTSIGVSAFDSCTSLTSITIPNSVTEIGERAFGDCSSLTSVIIPDSVTSIGYRAFYNCSNLTSVTIPNSVTSIGEDAFHSCNSLTSVTITDLSAWCKIDFGGYYANPLIYAKKLYLNSSEVTNLTIPSDITEIKKYAFRNCSSLTSVTIGNSVTSIGERAFQYCTSLTSVTIGNSVTSIVNDAFAGCTSLTSVAIPDSVTEIGSAVFWKCSNLTSVTIGNSVTSIGNQAFQYCNSLTSVTIPDSVTSIGKQAFDVCSSLTSVYCKPTTPPAGGQYLFDQSASGRKIYVPYNSVNAYKSADGWSRYASDIVGYDFETNEIYEPKLLYTSTDGKIVTPYSSDAFGANIISNTYENGVGIIKFDAPITSIGEKAFYGYKTSCNTLKSVTIPDSVTSIGSSAFAYCESLTSITIPENLTTIGSWAFYYCKCLTSIAIPNKVTTIGEYAFQYCKSLTSVTIPNKITSITDGVFSGCSSLQSVIIPNSVTKIGVSAFEGCSSLQSVTIPNKVTKIGDYVFFGCSSLQSVYCKPTTPPSLGGVTFGNEFSPTISTAAFSGNASGRKIYVPTASVASYKAKIYWSSYADDIVGYDF